MEAGLEDLHITDSSSDGVEKSLAKFIDILDATKKRKQVMRVLKEEQCNSKFFKLLEEWLQKRLVALDITIMKKVSSLLETSDTSCNVVKRSFKALIAYLRHFLAVLCDRERSEIEFPNSDKFNMYSILVVKICLQTTQFLPDEVKSVVYAENATSTQDGSCLELLYSFLVEILCDGCFTKECSSLAATTIALLFNCCEHNAVTLASVKRLLSLFSNQYSYKKDAGSVQAGNISIRCPLSVSSPYSSTIFISGFLRIKSPLLLERSGSDLVLDDMFEVITVGNHNDSATKYLCVETLHSWMTYINTLGIDQLHSHYCDAQTLFLNGNSKYSGVVMTWIWKHIEDLVDGIPAIIQKIFALLLMLNKKEYEHQNVKHSNTDNQFFMSVVQDVLARSWQEKGKWLLLAKLVPFLTANQLLLRHPTLPEEMIRCLSTCGLAAISNEVYQAILKDIRKSIDLDGQSVADWSTWFGKVIICALQSENPLLRQNIGIYWIPSTVQILPDCLLAMEKDTRSQFLSKQEKNTLHAHIIILKCCRDFALIKNDLLEQCKGILSKGLEHPDLEIRLGAFATLTCNPKKTEPLAAAFHGMLLSFVEDNLNNDSSKFRQQMLSCLKKLLINTRESCVVLHRNQFNEQKRKNVEELPKTLRHLMELVEGLLTICKSGLHPGVLFQRKKTSLLMFQLLTELFVYIDDETLRKKGAAADNAKLFLNFVKEIAWKSAGSHVWDILNAVDVELLYCMEDQHDEIRELSFEILNYHQIISNDCLLTEKKCFDTTLLRVLTLLDSAKYHEAESGALLTRFLVTRLVSNRDVMQNLDVVKSDMSDENASQNSEYPNQLTLPYLLLKRAKSSLEAADKDVLLVASYRPIFGILLALSQILNTLDNLCSMSELHSFIKELVSSCDAIALLTLQLLSVPTDDQGSVRETVKSESSPSFADMDVALDSVLEGCPSYLAQRNLLGHTHCRELVQSFCWLNLKAISLVYSRLSFLIKGITDQDFVLTILQTVYTFFYNTLIKCRHKGVIEASLLSLTVFSKNLASVAAYWKKMESWCFDTLQMAVDMSQHASVTKRSAGIPMFIQAILSSNPTKENSKLLNKSMAYLLTIAKTELPNIVDMNYDLPQFNALNIMRTIFRDACLGSAVLSFAEEAVVLTTNGFSSPSWSIRNASTILLGTLVPRMLGQRISQEESHLQNTSTVDVFFYRYPKLIDYFESCLQISSGNTPGKVLCGKSIAPQVIPALTFLSKLSSPCKEKCEELISRFLPLLHTFISSPVCAIRELATSSIIAFTPKEDDRSLVQSTLQHILHETSNNTIHSLCMILQKTISRSNDLTEVSTIICECYTRNNGLLSRCSSDLISHGVLNEVMIKCYSQLKTEPSLRIMMQLVQKLLLLEDVTRFHCMFLGVPIFVNSTARIVMLLWCKDVPEELSNNVFDDFMDSSSNDLHVYILNNVGASISDMHVSLRSRLVDLIIRNIHYSNCRMLIEASVSCLSNLVDKEVSLQVLSEVSILNRLFELMHTYQRLVTFILPTIAKLLAYSSCSEERANTGCSFNERHEDSSYIGMQCHLCDRIIQYSTPDQDENLRYAAARSLGLLQQLTTTDNHCGGDLFKRAVHNILNSALLLLQDEDENIRQMANNSLQFINKSALSFVETNEIDNTEFYEDRTDLQCNITLKNLFLFARCRALEETTYFEWMVSVLTHHNQDDFTHESSDLILFDQEAANLYAEEVVVVDFVSNAIASLFNALLMPSKESSRETYETYHSLAADKCHAFCLRSMEWLRDKKERYGEFSKSVYGPFGSRRYFIVLHRLLGCLKVLVVGGITEKEKLSIKDTYLSFLGGMVDNFVIPPLIKKNLNVLSELVCPVEI